MRRGVSFATTAGLACVLGAGLVIHAAQRAAGQGTEYIEVPAWPRAATSAAGTPTPWNFGQVAAVATDADGNILILHRGAEPILAFDSGGRFIRSWGEGLFSHGKVAGIASGDRVPGGSGYTAVYGPAGCHACGAHSIRVDPVGNVWVVDAPGHVIYKMDPRGRVLMELGTKGVPGISRHTFNLPTDVAFAPNGDVYVSDGYGNPRVVQYSADGRFLGEWGTRGTGPGEFGLPHNLVVDAQGRVYVTDRDNQRVQVFDADGTFLSEWSDIGAVSTLYLTDEQQMWAGGVLRTLDGEVVAHLPGGGGGHGTTVGEAGDVYVAQLGGSVQKFVSQ